MNNKMMALGFVAVVVTVVLLIWKPWDKSTATYSPKQYWHTKRRREGLEPSTASTEIDQVAEISPVGTTQLDGDIPGSIASINDPTFLTTPSIVLSTTSRIGANLKYKNLTTDIRGSIPRVYGGSGSTFNQNIQLEDSNISPDTY